MKNKPRIRFDPSTQKWEMHAVMDNDKSKMTLKGPSVSVMYKVVSESNKRLMQRLAARH